MNKCTYKLLAYYSPNSKRHSLLK